MFYLKRGSSIVWDFEIFYILDIAKIVSIRRRRIPTQSVTGSPGR